LANSLPSIVLQSDGILSRLTSATLSHPSLKAELGASILSSRPPQPHHIVTD